MLKIGLLITFMFIVGFATGFFIGFKLYDNFSGKEEYETKSLHCDDESSRTITNDPNA